MGRVGGIRGGTWTFRAPAVLGPAAALVRPARPRMAFADVSLTAEGSDEPAARAGTVYALLG